MFELALGIEFKINEKLIKAKVALKLVPSFDVCFCEG